VMYDNEIFDPFELISMKHVVKTNSHDTWGELQDSWQEVCTPS
jgi:hypothetical protein